MQNEEIEEAVDSSAARSSIRDEVYLSLRNRILDMASVLDEPLRLREEDVARELGVSRTPVREALKRLGQEGLLNIQPGRGAVLTPITNKEYCDWLKIRAELEAFAASEAALNATAHDVEQLRALFAPFDDSTLNEQVDKYAAANVEFHALLIRLANNVLLEKIWNAFGHGQMLRSRTIKRLNRAHNSLQEHLAIIDAIDKRNAPLASRLAREHALELLAQIIQNPPR